MPVKCLAYTLLGILSGGIMFGYHVPKLFLGINIREISQDGNPGVANAFKYGGLTVGIITLILDLAKGFIPVFLAARVIPVNSLYITPIIIAPVIGHALAPLYKSGGGKAICTSFGALMGLFFYSYAAVLLAALYIINAGIFHIKPNERCSVITFAEFAAVCAVSCFITNHFGVTLGTLGIAAIVIYRNMDMERLRSTATFRWLFQK